MCRANYSAGNIFEDALAVYRHQLDLPAMNLNLGFISKTETVGSTDKFLHKFPYLASVTVNMHNVKAVLDLAIRREDLNDSSLSYQTVIGISVQIQRWTMGY